MDFLLTSFYWVSEAQCAMNRVPCMEPTELCFRLLYVSKHCKSGMAQ